MSDINGNWHIKQNFHALTFSQENSSKKRLLISQFT